MNDIPESVIHYLLAAAIPAGGAFFMFLLKRSFADFETKISTLFTDLKEVIKQGNDHRTEIALIKQSVEKLEVQVNGRKRRS